jgi:hypothetical protein
MKPEGRRAPIDTIVASKTTMGQQASVWAKRTDGFCARRFDSELQVGAGHKPEIESLFDGMQIRSTCLCIAAQDRPAARRRYASKGTRESW